MATPPVPTPVVQPATTPLENVVKDAETITKDAEKLSADAKAAEAAASNQSDQAAKEANRQLVVDDATKMLDDIKGATNQAQVHELVEKLRTLIKANL